MILKWRRQSTLCKRHATWRWALLSRRLDRNPEFPGLIGKAARKSRLFFMSEQPDVSGVKQSLASKTRSVLGFSCYERQRLESCGEIACRYRGTWTRCATSPRRAWSQPARRCQQDGSVRFDAVTH